MENPIKIDDLGVPLTILETLTCFDQFFFGQLGGCSVRTEQNINL